MELKIIKQFGPSVVKVKIPEKILNDLNQYINQTISDREKSKSIDLGKKLVGDVTQEFNIEPKFAEEIGWIKFLAACVHEWIRIETKIKIKNFTLKNTWVVRQYKNEYNPVHWHSGHISGAGFLKVPDTFGKHVQDKGDKEYFGGTLNLIHGTRQFMSNSKLKIIPEVGDFYIFPHYLMHTVYPFKGSDQERRSISFNANIDEEVFNVYGS
jgi:hypothetical protein